MSIGCRVGVGVGVIVGLGVRVGVGVLVQVAVGEGNAVEEGCGDNTADTAIGVAEPCIWIASPELMPLQAALKIVNTSRSVVKFEIGRCFHMAKTNNSYEYTPKQAGFRLGIDKSDFCGRNTKRGNNMPRHKVTNR